VAAIAAWTHGDYRHGKELANARLLEELGTSGRELTSTYFTLAVCERHLGNVVRSEELFEQASVLARADHDERMFSLIVNARGNSAHSQRRYAEARVQLEESLAIERRLDLLGAPSNNLVDLGFIALAETRIDDADTSFRESLAIYRAEEIVDENVIYSVEGFAEVALARRDPARAARLLAATTRPRAKVTYASDFYPIGEETRERTLEAARAALDEAEFAAAWAEGEALSLEAAADMAAAVPATRP
jgi:tetratricopeptide (TPR) repeat protein